MCLLVSVVSSISDCGHKAKRPASVTHRVLNVFSCLLCFFFVVDLDLALTKSRSVSRNWWRGAGLLLENGRGKNKQNLIAFSGYDFEKILYSTS